MRNIIKIILLFTIISVESFAQNVANSPYSRFGLGDVNGNYAASLSGMGSVGVGISNPLIINHHNPASYALGYRQRFIMQTGLYHTTNQMSSISNNEEKSQITNYSNLSHFNIGFPITKWWGASVGLLPYSDMAYNFTDEYYDSDELIAELSFEGEGGLSRFYIGHAVQPHKNFSIGMNINYLFGILSTDRKVIFQDETFLNSRQTESTRVKGFYYDFGAIFTSKLKDWNFSASTTVDNGGNISAKNTVLSQTFRVNNLLEITEDDTLLIQDHGELILPTGFSAGFSFSNDKWIIAADYVVKNWSEFKLFGESDYLDNSSRYALGVQLTPDRKAINKYWKMIRYRMGVYSSNTYLNLRNQHLEERVISFGFGLPMKRTGAFLNLSAEFGERGTTDENLIQDKFARFKVGLVLSDIWFIKRKYD